MLFVQILAVRQCAELVAQVREKQGAKGGIRGDQVAHGLMRQLVGHHFFGRHKPAADLARHQPPTIKTVIRPVGGVHFALVKLGYKPFNDDKKMGRGDAQVKNRLALAEIGDIDAVTNQSLLVWAQTVKGGSRKIKSIGHKSDLLASPSIQRRMPCATLATLSQFASNQGSPER